MGYSFAGKERSSFFPVYSEVWGACLAWLKHKITIIFPRGVAFSSRSIPSQKKISDFGRISQAKLGSFLAFLWFSDQICSWQKNAPKYPPIERGGSKTPKNQYIKNLYSSQKFYYIFTKNTRNIWQKKFRYHDFAFLTTIIHIHYFQKRACNS